MEYRGFCLEVELDRDEDCIKRFHYAVSRKTGRSYPFNYSPYRNPSFEEFQTIVNNLVFRDFVYEGSLKRETEEHRSL